MKESGESAPARVGQYVLLAELGRGAMGRVYLASAPTGALVAVKMVRQQHLMNEDDDFRTRFAREVEASRRVVSSHTAAVVDADAYADVPWLASEFVPGPTLFEAVGPDRPLPEDAVLRLAAGLAAALVDVHAAHLIHRDLKPTNVILAADGVRVIDFGIARAIGREPGGGTTLTHTGWLLGTPAYMSPEQAQGRPLTAASDVFSLGSVLYLACTGVDAFAGPDTPQVLYQVVHSEPDRVALPQRVRDIVDLCWAKDPARRATAEQLVAAIGPQPPAAQPWPGHVDEFTASQQAGIGNLPPAGTQIGPLTAPTGYRPWPGTPAGTVTSPAPAGRKRRRFAIAAVSVVALLVIAGIVLAQLNKSTNHANGAPTTTPTTAPTTAPIDEMATAKVGDCVKYTGNEKSPTLIPATCQTGVFEVVRVLTGTIDTTGCDSFPDDTFNIYSTDDDDVLCLSYRYNGDAFYASPGDCVFGPTPTSYWFTEPCRPGNFTVKETHQGTTDPHLCPGWPDSDLHVDDTDPHQSDQDVVLCLAMNYPNAAGYATLGQCMDETVSGKDLSFTDVGQCDQGANVAVVGRSNVYNDVAMCGSKPLYTWAPPDYPSLAFTICLQDT